MAGQTRKVRKKAKEVSLAEVKDDLSRYLREATKGEIVITRHGKPAGVLIGFEFRKTTGLTTGLRMIRRFCGAFRRHETACVLGAV